MTTAFMDPRWKDLYKIAGIAAIISELVIVLGLVTYFIWTYAPGMETTESILLKLQNDTLGALISLDLFLFIGNLFSVTLFLALYLSLKQVNESYALIAFVLGLIGLILLIPARPIMELYLLSRSYTLATTEAAKSQYLGAGTTLLTLFDGTGWFLNTLLGGLSLLISSLLMLRGNIYTKATAYVGIMSNFAVCGFFLPGIGILLLFLSVPGYMIWYFLLARRFFEMGQSN